MTLSIVTSVIVMLSVLCVTAGFAVTRRDKSVADRLDVYLASGDPSQVVTLKELELSRPFSERVILPIAQRAARVFAWMLPQNRMNALRARLIMAGNPGGINAYQFAGVTKEGQVQPAEKWTTTTVQKIVDHIREQEHRPTSGRAVHPRPQLLRHDGKRFVPGFGGRFLRLPPRRRRKNPRPA